MLVFKSAILINSPDFDQQNASCYNKNPEYPFHPEHPVFLTLEEKKGKTMFRNLVIKNRSYRRFYQDHAVDLDTLKSLVDLARQTASGRNIQPLKYMLSADAEMNAVIFAHLAWAGYLPEWGGPKEGEKPSAYILILLDKQVSESSGVDQGIAAQTILLGATELGLGGCILGSVKRPELKQALAIPGQYDILLVVALGKPKETVVIDEIDPGGDIKYYRDAAQVHHVPKRKLKDVIL
jgi:nitroreductase